MPCPVAGAVGTAPPVPPAAPFTGPGAPAPPFTSPATMEGPLDATERAVAAEGPPGGADGSCRTAPAGTPGIPGCDGVAPRAAGRATGDDGPPGGDRPSSRDAQANGSVVPGGGGDTGWADPFGDDRPVDAAADEAPGPVRRVVTARPPAGADSPAPGAGGEEMAGRRPPDVAGSGDVEVGVALPARAKAPADEGPEPTPGPEPATGPGGCAPGAFAVTGGTSPARARSMPRAAVLVTAAGFDPCPPDPDERSDAGSAVPVGVVTAGTGTSADDPLCPVGPFPSTALPDALGPWPGPACSPRAAVGGAAGVAGVAAVVGVGAVAGADESTSAKVGPAAAEGDPLRPGPPVPVREEWAVLPAAAAPEPSTVGLEAPGPFDAVAPASPTGPAWGGRAARGPSVGAPGTPLMPPNPPSP